MMHSTQILYDSLRDTLRDIDKQIDVMRRDAYRNQPITAMHEPVDPDLVFKTKYRDGKYVAADLLVAKAATLSAMATLKASEKK